ncbi:MAG TPA: thioesterase family protein [Anaerolineae bacterium]|nr:thioesterase family protein [Anaerolineae bacterium]
MSESGPRPLLVELPIVVKTYDVDYAQIVHNAVYVRWLEDLRLQVMTEHYPLQDLLEVKQSPILERTEINYHQPLRLFEEAVGRMWVSKLGKARWEVEAEICRGEVVAATARQTGYFIDFEEYRPVRIPAVLRASWEADLEAGDHNS